MKRKALLLIIPFAAAGLAGCERANPNPPGPTPDPQCESATVNIKSAGDVTTIKPTATLQLTAEVNISSCTFEWKSSDSTIATVDANGLVTGVKAGDVVISYGPGSFNLKVDDDAPTPPPVVEGNVYLFNNTFGEVKPFSGIDEEGFLGTLVTQGEDIIKGYQDATNSYIGGNGGNEADGSNWTLLNCLKVGKSKNKGSITLKLDSSIAFSSIKVKAIGSRDDGELTINGVTKAVAKKAVKDDLEPVEVEFEVSSGASELVISNKDDASANFAIMITSIEFVKGDTPTPTKEVKSIEITGTPKTAYKEGEAYSAAGLSVVATYTDDTTGTVSATITPNKAKAEVGDTIVTFSATYGGKTATKEVNVTVEAKPAPTGESSIYTFTNDKTEAQNMKDWTSEQFMQHVVLDGSEVITGIKDITNAYIGANGGSNETAWNIWNCFKVGKSSASGTATLTLDSSVLFESIKVSAIGNRDDGTLTINGVTKNVTKKAVKGDLEPMELEFDIAGGISELVISSKEATSGNYGISITKIEFVGGGTPVEPSVEKVELDKSTLNLQPEGSAKLTATVTVKGGAAQTVTWSSDNEAIATVDNDGTVHAVAVGDANITATSTVDSGKHASCAVSVTEAPVDVLETISASGYTNEVEKDAAYEFDGKVYGHYSVSGDVELNSADWSVTTPINTSEVGAKVGIITYSKDGVVKTCEFNVTVKAPKPAPAEVDVSYSFAAVKDSSGKQYTSETLKADFTAGLSKGDDIVNTVVPTVLFGADGSLKPGNKNGGGSIEINTTKNIVGVVVTAKDYGTDGSSISVAGEESALTAASAEYAASFAACKSVTISTTKRAYIEAIGFVLEGSTPVTPAVNGVTVSPKTAKLDLTENTSVTLTATVDAVGGAEKTVTWSVVDADPTGCVTVENGVVTAVAEGSAKVVATSTFNTEKSDYCEVSVLSEPAPQPELDSITVDASNAKVAYTEGETVVKDGLVVTAHYTNGGEDKVLQAADYTVSPSGALTTSDDTVTVTYQGKTNTYAITVSEKTGPQHKGDQSDPFTVDDAKMIFDGLDTGEIEGPYYVTGVIAASPAPVVNGGRGQFYLEGTSTNLYVYNANNIGGFNNLTTADIPVGSTVVLVGGIKNFSGTFEMCYNKENPAISCELISVAKPTVHVTGVSFDPTEITIGVDGNATLSPVVAPATASDKSCTYEIVSGGDYVSLTGAKVTGVAEGDAVIKATTVDGGYQASVTIHVTGDAPVVEPVDYSMEFTNGKLPTGWTNNSGQAYNSTYWVMKGAGASLTGSNLFDAQTSIDITLKLASSNGGSADKENVITVYGIDANGNKVNDATAVLKFNSSGNFSNAAGALENSSDYKVTVSGEGIVGIIIEFTTKGYNTVVISCAIKTAE